MALPRGFRKPREERNGAAALISLHNILTCPALPSSRVASDDRSVAVAITLNLRAEPDGVSGRVRLGRSSPRLSRFGSWGAAAVSVGLLGPLMLAIAAGPAQRVGMSWPQHVLSTVDAGGLRAALLRVWVWAGPALAVAVSAAAMLRVTFSGGHGPAAELTIRLGVIGILAFALALVLAAAFYGHLVADAIACTNGVRSAC